MRPTVPPFRTEPTLTRGRHFIRPPDLVYTPQGIVTSRFNQRLVFEFPTIGIPRRRQVRRRDEQRVDGILAVGVDAALDALVVRLVLLPIVLRFGNHHS